MTIFGTSGDDNLVGTPGSDRFNLSQGGNDSVQGEGGSDLFWMGATLTANDRIDGGAGYDVVGLKGDYSAGLVLGSGTIVNIERISLDPGYNYNLTLNNDNVLPDKWLAIAGKFLHAGNYLIVDGSEVLDGRLRIYGGGGDDVITGGARADRIFSGEGGSDTIHAGGGNDWIIMGGSFDSTDRIDGGAGHDTMTLTGNYSAGLTITSSMMSNVETLILNYVDDYILSIDNGVVASGATLTVSASTLKSFTLTFDGSAEADGRLVVIGGAGDDVIEGGKSADTLTGNAGADTFVYTSIAESTGTTHDVITDFDAAVDGFKFGVVPSGYDGMHSETLDANQFNESLAAAALAGGLQSGQAIIIQGDGSSGSLAGRLFLIVDANGDGIYTSGSDYVVEITNASNLGSFGVNDFH